MPATIDNKNIEIEKGGISMKRFREDILFVIMTYVIYVSSFVLINSKDGGSIWLILGTGALLLIGVVLEIIVIVRTATDYTKIMQENFGNEIDSVFIKKWKAIKFATIPLFIINFIYCFGLLMSFFGAIGIPFYAIPMYSITVTSGVVGVLALLRIRKVIPEVDRKLVLHAILQFICVLDVIDTIVILRKLKKNDKISKSIILNESENE